MSFTHYLLQLNFKFSDSLRGYPKISSYFGWCESQRSWTNWEIHWNNTINWRDNTETAT